MFTEEAPSAYLSVYLSCDRNLKLIQLIVYVFYFTYFVTGGALKFTVKPPNPSYASNGSNATLMWDYDTENELLGIVYSVKVPNGKFLKMLVKSVGGSVTDAQNIPSAYKGRVKIEGRATLVIENITPQDNTEFKCALTPKSGTDLESDVQLIVTGMYCKIYEDFIIINICSSCKM